MAEFICRLGTPAGDVVTRTVEALGVHEARARLEREGFKVFNVTPPKAERRYYPNETWRLRWPRQGQSQRFSPLQSATRGVVTRRYSDSSGHLHAAHAGQLQRVCARCWETSKSRFAVVLRYRRRLPRRARSFPRIYTASILAGERSGALDEVLSRYVNLHATQVGLRRKIRGALAYPMFLLFASVGMVMFLTIYVVPRMSDLFTGFGGNLPFVTQIGAGPFQLAVGEYFLVWPIASLAARSHLESGRAPRPAVSRSMRLN